MRSEKWHRMPFHSSVTMSEWMTASAQERADAKHRVDHGPSQIYAFSHPYTHITHTIWSFNSCKATLGNPNVKRVTILC